MPQKTTPRKRPGRTGSRVRTPSKSPGAVPPNIEDNDDWAEKRANKEERKQSALARTASRKSPYQKKTVSTTGKELNADGIQDLYSACIKLSADNKIDKKNAWNLNLIDYMEDMVSSASNTDEDGATNFAAAGSTIDAGIKIYSSRVDCVHAEAYKVLGNLSRNGNKPAAEDEDGEDGDERSGQAEQKKKHKSRYGGVTLEPNADNLNLKELEYQITTDPLFQKTSASFDEGGAKGMLLNHLCVQNGCTLVFDSNDALEDKERVGSEFLEGMEAANDDEEDALDLGEAASGELQNILRSIGSAELTPGFTEFRLARAEGRDFTEPALDLAAAENDEYEYDEEEGGYDDGFDDDDDDDDDGGGSGGYNMATEAGFSGGSGTSGGGMFGAPASAEPLDFPQEMLTADGKAGGAQIDEAALEDMIYGGNWSGSGGFKFSSKKKVAKEEEEEDKERAPKEKFFIDFSIPIPEGALDGSELDDFGRPLDTFQLSKQVLENQTEAATTLPADRNMYKLKDLYTLFTKPNLAVRTGQLSKAVIEAGMAATGEGGGDWSHLRYLSTETMFLYDYDNANDVENFVPDMNNDGPNMGDSDDDSDDGGDGDGFAFPDETIDESGFIAQPETCDKVKINYAKAAKKVDVQLLKESIWSRIERDGLGGPVEKSALAEKDGNVAPEDEDEEEDHEQSPGGKELDFNRVIQKFHTQVPKPKQEMLKDVSVPFCFICLLHLANEHNLVLTDEKTGDLSKLVIGGDNSGKEASGSCDWKKATKQFSAITKGATGVKA